MSFRSDYQDSMPKEMLRHCIDNEVRVIVINFEPHLVATDKPTKKRMVIGLVHRDDETYMLSLLTEQSSGLIKKMIKRGGIFSVSGVFSRDLFCGDGGEFYRPIIGKLEVV